MLTDFQNSFTNRFTSKFATKFSLTIPPYINCVTTLPCEISVFKKMQCLVYQASCHAKLRHSKQLLKIPYSDFCIIQFNDSKIYRVEILKFPHCHCTHLLRRDTEEKILQQNAFAYDDWSVSHVLPVTSPDVHRF